LILFLDVEIFLLWEPPTSDEAVFIVTSSKKVKVKVTLRLTVSQSVCLRVEPNLGLLKGFFFLQSYCLVFLGRPL
jgi:hypothetical protein